MSPFYEIIANTIAGAHTVLVIYFLGGWLIPFTSMKKRSMSALVIGGIILFFHYSSICPLTLWERQLRIAGGSSDIDNMWFIERLSAQFGLQLDSSVLNTFSLGVSELAP